MAQGAVAVVTGGLGGIGRVYVKALLKEGAKGVAIWDVVANGSEDFLKELEKEFGGGRAIFVKVDVSDTKQIEDAYEKTVEHFNQLDLVINNAAVGSATIEKTVQVNLTSVMFSTTLATTKYFPKYAKHKVPVIVNTGSSLGLSTTDFALTYTTTKHAIVAFGRCLGVATNTSDSPEHNFRILTICPGVTDTVFFDGGGPGERGEMFRKQIQSPEVLGPALIQILHEGKSGSVWFVNMGKIKEIDYSVINESMTEQLHNMGECVTCNHK